MLCFQQRGAGAGVGLFPDPELVLHISDKKLALVQKKKKWLQHGSTEKLVSEFGTVMSVKVPQAIASKSLAYLENYIS